MTEGRLVRAVASAYEALSWRKQDHGPFKIPRATKAELLPAVLAAAAVLLEPESIPASPPMPWQREQIAARNAAFAARLAEIQRETEGGKDDG